MMDYWKFIKAAMMFGFIYGMMMGMFLALWAYVSLGL